MGQIVVPSVTVMHQNKVFSVPT